MIVQNNKAGWVQDAGRNEIEMWMDVIPNDPEEAKHLESLVTDEEEFKVVALFVGGGLKLRINSRRDKTLEQQAAERAAAAKVAADKVAAEQKAAAEAAAVQAKKDAEANAKIAVVASAVVKALQEAKQI